MVRRNSGNNTNWLFNSGFTWTGANDQITWKDQANWDSGDGSAGDDGYPDDANDAATIDSTDDNITITGVLLVGGLTINSCFHR